MTANSETPDPISPARRWARGLRKTAAIVLALGIISAGTLYWLAPPPEDLGDDVVTARNSKKVQRDIEVNFGKMGLFSADLMQDLRDPGTQALIIIVTAAVIAGGCFYFARLLDFDDDQAR